LSNTSLGKSWSLSYKIERPFGTRFYVSGSYLYNRAFSVNDGTSSVALSNWRYTPAGLNPNGAILARSNHDVGHRVNLMASVPVKLVWGIRSNVSIFYNGQSGRPYSLGFNGDVNSDSYSNNDLLYIPATSDQVVVYSSVTGQTVTWKQLDDFLNSTAAKDYRG